VIARDKKGYGKRYVYPRGLYELKEIDGIERPVPTARVDPVSTLIPNK